MVNIIIYHLNLGMIITKGLCLVKELGKGKALANFLEVDRLKANSFLKIVLRQ